MNSYLVSELTALRELVQSLNIRLAESPESVLLNQQWYTLDEACALKGIIAKTARNQPSLQPNGGEPDAVVGRKRRWRRDTIRRWLDETDEDLES